MCAKTIMDNFGKEYLLKMADEFDNTERDEKGIIKLTDELAKEISKNLRNIANGEI